MTSPVAAMASRGATPFNPVNLVCARHFPQLPLEIPRILLGAWVANEDAVGFDDPCWLALIAPPGSLKTVLLTALSDATKGYVLDSLTPQTFLSGLVFDDGQKHRKVGLLHQLGARPNVFVKDLSGILSKRGWDRDEILAQLRGIYDGEYARPTGTGGHDDVARWKGRMTLMVGVTAVIDLYHALNNQLGERFVHLRYSIPEEDVTAVSGQALRNSRDGVNGRAALASAFCLAVERARPQLSRNVLTDAMQRRLANLVAFVTKARTGVLRDRLGEVVQLPAPEGPGRLTKQLAALACGLAALSGSDALSEADWRLVERVAFDSIPELRRNILWALYDQGRSCLPDLRGLVGVSDPTIRRHLEDLELVGLAERVNHGEGRRAEWKPSPMGLRYLSLSRG